MSVEHQRFSHYSRYLFATIKEADGCGGCKTTFVLSNLTWLPQGPHCHNGTQESFSFVTFWVWIILYGKQRVPGLFLDHALRESEGKIPDPSGSASDLGRVSTPFLSYTLAEQVGMSGAVQMPDRKSGQGTSPPVHSLQITQVANLVFPPNLVVSPKKANLVFPPFFVF